MKNLIFEVSYEVLNKRSAVETFLKTKAHTMVGKYEGHYIMCGPIEENKQHLMMNFTDQRTHDSVWGLLIRKFEEQYNLPDGTIKYGYWNLIDTRVQCILLPLKALQSDSIKNIHASAIEQLKDMTGLTYDSVKNQHGPINFGIMTWIFYSFLLNHCVNDGPRYRNIIVQIHDWTSCFGMCLFKRNPIEQILYGRHDLNTNQIKFVYTVHNPALARAMGEDNVLVDYFKKNEHYDKSEVDKLAKKYNVVYETLIEINAVSAADKTTTISSVTAKECRILLNKEPDVITWAGIGVDHQQGLYDWYEFHSTHKTNKQKIFAFLQTLFSGLNVDHTQVVFTAWRTNYNIEDIKLFIDSITLVKTALESEVNLKKYPELQKRQIVALIIAPTHNNGIAEHVLQTMNLTQEIKIVTDSVAKTAQNCIVDQLCATDNVNILETTIGDLLGSKVTAALQRIQQAVNGNTVDQPLTTHRVPDNDPIISYIKSKGFSNNHSSKVKILYIPETLTKTALFGLDYKDFIRGAHLGVFSSHYKPFGYGGPESVCVGTPCIVSDGVGFASLVKKAEEQLGSHDHIRGMSQNPWARAPLGVRVIEMDGKNKTAAEAQADAITEYLRIDIETRIAMRNNMTRNSVFLDWSEQVEHFVQIYNELTK